MDKHCNPHFLLRPTVSVLALLPAPLLLAPSPAALLSDGSLKDAPLMSILLSTPILSISELALIERGTIPAPPGGPPEETPEDPPETSPGFQPCGNRRSTLSLRAADWLSLMEFEVSGEGVVEEDEEEEELKMKELERVSLRTPIGADWTTTAFSSRVSTAGTWD